MEIEKDYEPEPLSVRNVRQFVTKGLANITPNSDDVVLAASEFATNAVIHARTQFRVRLEVRNRVIRLEVSDRSSTIPVIEGLDPSHRGLRIVRAVATDWGVDPTASGKTIWAEFLSAAADQDGRSAG